MVEYKLMGRVPNSDISDFYRNERVDCFITTSSTEGGAPVSVAEAISAGIPVIATDVGGLSEMVRGNGILLSPEPSVDQVADAIVYMATLDTATVENMRRASRKIWENKFDAVKNAKTFCEYLKTFFDDEPSDHRANPRIILITAGYPYGGEQSFIEPELREILKSYDVDIICLTDDERYKANKELAEQYISRLKSDQPDELHSLSVTRADSAWHLHKCRKYFVKYYKDKSIVAERRSIIHSGERVILRLWESMKCYASTEVFYKETLKGVLEHVDPTNTIIYTYWHRDPTLAACLHRHEYNGLKIITREHGYDLYDERTGVSNRQPFREVMDPLLDGIIFACEAGLKYYIHRNHIKAPGNKYHIFYLGSADSGVYTDTGSGNEYPDGDVFRIVSCSNLLPLKRVDLIIRGLKLASERLPDKKIEWIHFGDGDLMADIQVLAGEELGGFVPKENDGKTH